jgi:hypothetical protein
MAGAFCPLLEPAGIVERLTIWIKHTVKDHLHTVKDQIGGGMDSSVHWHLLVCGWMVHANVALLPHALVVWRAWVPLGTVTFAAALIDGVCHT